MDRLDSELLAAIGRNLKAERSRRGLTQEDVARQIDMNPRQYSKLEVGAHDSGVTKYVRAARAIGMPLDELFHGIEEQA